MHSPIRVGTPSYARRIACLGRRVARGEANRFNQSARREERDHLTRERNIAGGLNNETGGLAIRAQSRSAVDKRRLRNELRIGALEVAVLVRKSRLLRAAPQREGASRARAWPRCLAALLPCRQLLDERLAFCTFESFAAPHVCLVVWRYAVAAANRARRGGA